MLETAEDVVADDRTGVIVGCTAVDIETVDCGIIGVAALKSAKRRSRSATASAGMETVTPVLGADKVVEVDDVASDFGFDIIIVKFNQFSKFYFVQRKPDNCGRIEVKKKHEQCSICQQSYVATKVSITSNF